MSTADARAATAASFGAVEAASRTEEIVRDLAAIVWEMDAATLRFTFVGGQAESILGYSRQAWLSRPGFWAEHVSAEDRDAAVAACAQAAAAGRDLRVEYRMIAADGREVWIDHRARFVPAQDGRGAMFRGLLLDVSSDKLVGEERRRAEERLGQARTMDAVGRLAGGIAHDFNNLLTAVVGFGEIAGTHLGPSHPQHASIDQIVRAGERATELTQELLAFSRRQMFEAETFDLRAVVAGLAPTFERRLGADVEVRVAEAADLGLVRADRGRLERVVLNLLVHARDAMPDGGRISVELANVDLDADYVARRPDARPGRHVLLAVADTGPGVDEATLARLFEPFFTTEEFGRGTGLGLAVVYGVARQCGGHVAVRSEIGRGTTVEVYLPRFDAATAPEAATQDADDGPRGSETVLVAEDEPGVRALAVAVLEDLGYDVVVASSGAAALEAAAARAGAIDLVVADVTMPGMSGHELVRRLAAERPGVRTLFMSGYTDDSAALDGVVENGAWFVQKPFTPDALAKTVRAALDAPSRARAGG